MIRGMVQGVGFRPFICRMAAKHRLVGEVDNRSDGVSVTVQGDLKTIDNFSSDILWNAPPASQIKSLEVNPVQVKNYNSFKIVESKDIPDLITEISPDIAVCQDCIEDMQKDPFRLDYPLINCTNCGPRFTIIERLPYDRTSTSMKSFGMCDNCNSEYNDLFNRRFHAQPTACNMCGPAYRYKDGKKELRKINDILNEVSGLIDKGKIVAFKGTGGYNLICDATNNDSVSELRRKKHRDARPFAVMFRGLDEVRDYCYLNDTEQHELESWRRPILILKQARPLSYAVNNGLSTIGAILPYMPIHYLLFRYLKTPSIVFTSGNISDEPVITDDDIAAKKLMTVADALVSYNRVIINRADDSVIRVANDKPVLIRRSRGFAPRPVDLQFNAEGIIALGAEQKNSFCIGKGSQAIMSQYIGDLKNPDTYDFFDESIERFRSIFRFKPAYIACDLHPDYLSTIHAEILSGETDLPVFRIQHHHAHIVSCMAEYGLDEEVIGICLDGTGLGTDGNIWGGEIMIADLTDFRRFAHFDYVPMPGGKNAIDEPWKMAFSYIYKYHGDKIDYSSINVFKEIDHQKLSLVKEMIDYKINSPLSSGAGRLFDAVAAITGLCPIATFDSEAPIRLESAADNFTTADYYPFGISGCRIVFKDTIDAILYDLAKEKTPVISAKFHNTIAQVILEVSERIRRETSINKVVLSGGVFQNIYLLEKSLSHLKRNGFRVFINKLVPVNDGGISLGQLVITSKLNRLCV